MASIFDNYDNLKEQYIPSNMNNKPCPPPPNPYLDPAIPKRPYEDYNAKGELVGYWWPYGNTVDLNFELTGMITLDDGNYLDVREFIKNKQIQIKLYNFRHEVIDTRIYEGKDYQELTYSRAQHVGPKTEGIYYIYDEEQRKYIAVDLPQQYNKDTIYYKENPVEIIYSIDEAMSLTLEKNTYYCSLSIINKGINETIFYQEDCTLTVR